MSEPTEEQVISWNIHNDHADGGEEFYEEDFDDDDEYDELAQQDADAEHERGYQF